VTAGDRIPIRLPPLPGEAIDSWLEAYARRLHVTVTEILAAAGLRWDKALKINGQRPWLHGLDAPALAVLSEVTGVSPDVLAGMTLARYEGTGLTGAAAGKGHRSPRWWRQPVGSRYCPRCLAANGGRWMLAWRVPWAFACSWHGDLLADGCPDCGGWKHLRTLARTPREPGRCDLTGLPLPPSAHLSLDCRSPCSRDPATTPAVPLPEAGRVLTAWRHAEDLTAALLAARDDHARLAAVQEELDDLHTVGRAAIAALYRGTALPPAATGVLSELGVQPAAPGTAAIAALYGTARGPRHRSAPVVAFGTAIADVMLHGRRDAPAPEITTWLADAAGGHGRQTCPSNVLAVWGNLRPTLKTAVINSLQPRMDAFVRLRHGLPAETACVPGPGRGDTRAAAMPPLLWGGWALRLMPPGRFKLPGFRAKLAVLLMVASSGADDYGQAARLLGLPAAPATRYTEFLYRLRQLGALEPVLACTSQLARRLEEHGAPVDYARRRQLRSLTRARLDIAGWRREASRLPDPYILSCRPKGKFVRLPHSAANEPFARLRLIEILTGIHPRYLAGPLQLPEARNYDYAQFILRLPEQMARFLDEHARRILNRAGISEPLTWEPPADWVTGVTWPGPDPDNVTPQALHPLLQSDLPMAVITARLATTADHVYLAAARHPAPQLPPGSTVLSGPPELPHLRQVTDLASQGLGLRAIAQATGWPEHNLMRVMDEEGLRSAASRSADIDLQWLREQYQTRGRSFRALAAESGIRVGALAAAARNAGLPIRPSGAASRNHPLGSLGGPAAFPPVVWHAFSRRLAEQRIRRLLAACGHPSLKHAASHLGIKTSILASQVSQLEAITGAALLHTGPDGRLALTRHGKQFVRDATPALEALAGRSRAGKAATQRDLDSQSTWSGTGSRRPGFGAARH
jgi:hypothetical protein